MKWETISRIIQLLIAISLGWIAFGQQISLNAADASVPGQEEIHVVISGVDSGIIRPFPVEIEDEVSIQCDD